MRKPLLSDSQWQKVEPLSPKLKRRKRGRPPKENRAVFEAILWVLKTGARWRDLPKDFDVSSSVAWKRRRAWEEKGVWLRLWRAFLCQPDERGRLDWQESFLDGSFASAKKGGDGVGKTKRGKGTKWMVVVDGSGVPLGSQLTSASPAEVKLAESTLRNIRVPGKAAPQTRPWRVIADLAYDRDQLRWSLCRREMLLIAPHRKNRRTPALNDGRSLRRYRKRWKVERTFAWLGNFRRLVVRYDRNLKMYAAFFHIACALITLRFVLK